MHVLDDVHPRGLTGQRDGVDQRRQPPPPGIRGDVGQPHRGVTDAQKVIEQQQVFRVGVGDLGSHARPGSPIVEIGHPQAVAQQPGHHVKRDVAGVGLAVGGEHRHIAARRERCGFADQSALADARRTHDIDHTPGAADGLVEDRGHGADFPLTADQNRLAAPTGRMVVDGHQSPGGHRCVSALDVHQLGLTQHRGLFDQAGGGLAEHHPTRRRHRFHSLRHPHLLTDRRVTHWARTGLTGNHLTRIQANPQLQHDTVTALNLGGQALCLLLDIQRGQARAESVILQRDRRPEQRHDPIAGELIDRAAVALHDDRCAVHQLGHDLAQPLRTHRRRDPHRPHHIGEQHSDLLVLGMLGLGYSGTAGVTESGIWPRLAAA